MVISDKLASMLNQQISHELHNALQYRSFGSWAEVRGLKRLPAYFYKQSEDEKHHAQIFTDHLNKANVQFSPTAIEQPVSSLSDCEEIANLRIELESKTTEQIKAMYDQAESDGDVGSSNLFQMMLEEQVAEEGESEQFASLVEESKGSLILLELAVPE